ncbi:helix-turn-helix domain-containing protein, partial [Enterococcus faecium]|nr:helix-turn-helix domain-containing protein [Enterococcus faecium]MCH3438176.1 helix-turn-helix domain-containing protein [Enterococcus faecium]
SFLLLSFSIILPYLIVDLKLCNRTNSTDPQKRLVFKTVVDMLKQGIPVAEIAKENGISRPTIYKIKKANDL